MKLQHGIYISRWLIECMYSGYAQGTVRMYIYVLGMKGYDTADFRVSWINLKLSWICKSMENISLFHLFRVPWEDWPHAFLTMPTQEIFDELTIFLNLYEHAKNQFIPSVNSSDTVHFRVRSHDWPNPFLTIATPKIFNHI